MNDNDASTLLPSSLKDIPAPADSDAFAEAGQKLVSEERWGELLSAYEQAALAYPDLESTIDAFGIMGDIALSRLGDVKKAKSFYKRALVSRPDDSRAQAGLLACEAAEGAGLLDPAGGDDGNSADAFARTLEDAHALIGEGKLDEAKEKLEGLLAASNLSDDARAQAETELAHLLQKKGADAAEVMAALQKAVELSPANAEALTELAALCEAEVDVAGLLSVNEHQIALMRDESERFALLTRMADLAQELMDAPLDAVGYLSRALALHPDDMSLALRIAELGEQNGTEGRQRAALGMLRAAGCAAAPEVKAELCRRAARLLSEVEGSEALRLSAWEAVLAFDPDDGEAVDAVALLAAAAIPVVQTEVAQPSPDESNKAADTQENASEAANVPDSDGGAGCGNQEVSEEAAAVQEASVAEAVAEGTLSENDAAIPVAEALTPEETLAYWRGVLSEKQDDEEALSALEELYGEESVRAEAARSVAEACAALGSSSREVSALDVLSSAAQSKEEKVKALTRQGSLYLEALGVPELAFAALAQALQLAPEDEALLAQTHRAAREADAVENFVEVLEEAAGNLSGKACLPLLREMAESCERDLEDTDCALDTWKRIREIAPDDLDALRHIAAVSRKMKMDAELARALLDLGDLTADPEEKKASWREAGEIFETKLSDRPGATEAFSRLSASFPDDLEALEALERLWMAAGDHARAAEVLEKELALLGTSPEAKEAAERLLHLCEADLPGASEGEKPRLARRIRELCTGVLESPDRAFVAACQHFSLGIEREALLPELSSLAQKTDNAEILAEVLEDALVSSDLGEDLRLGILRLAADLRSQLGDLDQAAGLYESILEAAPGDEASLKALSELYAKSGDSAALAETYLSQAAQAEDSGERLELQLKAASALLKSHRAEEALSQAESALSASPGHLSALKIMAEAAHAAGAWEKEADALKVLADNLPEGPERVRTALRRARLLEEKGEGAPAAIAYGQILADNPQESAAVRGLEGLLDSAAARPLAARVLEAHYRETGKERQLCGVLEILAEYASRQERGQILREAAAIREKLGEGALAFALLLRVLAESGPDEDLLNALERIAAQAGTFEELAAALEDALDRRPDEEMALCIRQHLAAIYDERLNAPDEAAAAYEALLRTMESALKGESEAGAGAESVRMCAVLDALIRLYRRGSRSGTQGESREEALVRVLWKRAELEADKAQEFRLFAEIADLCETDLGDIPQAIDALSSALSVSPQDASAAQNLARLYRAEGRFQELSDLLERLIGENEANAESGALDAAHLLDLKVELGNLCCTSLNDPERALSLFTEVLSKEPGHAGAIEGLEALSSEDGPCRARAASALQPVFESAGDAEKLIQVLEAQSEKATGGERAALCLKISKLYGGALKNPEMAFLYAGRALEASPGDRECLSEAHRLAPLAGAEEELLELVESVLPEAETDEARAALLRVLGELQLADGGLDEAAFETFQRLHEIVPGDAEALDRLELLSRRLSRWPTLCEVLRIRLSQASDAGDEASAAKIRRLLAEIQVGELGDGDAAVATLRTLVEAEPDDLGAWEKLGAILEKDRRYAELSEVLAREAEISLKRGDVEKALGLKIRRGTLCFEELLDRDGALALFREVLEMRPRHSEAVEALSRLASRDYAFAPACDLLAETLASSGQNQRLAELLEARASAVSGTERIAFLTESARIRLKLGRADLAFISLCQAHREDPSDAEVRKLLMQAARASDTLEELAILLEETLERLDGEDALQVNLTLGGLWASLRDNQSAAAAFERARALEKPPSHRALSALLKIYREEGETELYLSALQSRSELEADPKKRAEMLCEVGVVCRDRLSVPDLDRAAHAFEEALSIDGTCLTAARALSDLYEQAKSYDKLLAVLEASRPFVEGEALISLLTRMARVAEECLGDRAKATALYEEILSLSPRSADAIKALERLYESGGRDEEMVHLLDAKIATTVEPRELLRLFDQKGRALERLGRDEEAIRAFYSALERDPRTLPTLEALRGVLAKAGPSEELAQVMRRMIPLQASTSDVKAMRLSYAEVLFEVGKRSEAVDAARRVLDLEPHTAEEMQRASDLFQKLQSPADQVRALELLAMAFIEDDCEERALEVFYAIAEIQASELKKPLLAAASYERILDAEPASRDAFERIREIYASVLEWRKLAAVYERFIAALPEGDERLPLYRELAALQEEKLSEKDLAFITICRAFAESPEDEDAWCTAQRLAGETDNFEALETVCEEVLEAMAQGSRSVRLSLDLARIRDEKLDNPDGARELCRRVLDFDPSCAEALDILSEMAVRRGDFEDAVAALDEKRGILTDTDQEKAILSRIAEIREDALQDVSGAAAALTQSLELRADRATFRALADLFLRHGEAEKAIETLERARDAEGTPEGKAALQVEAAGIREKELGDDEGAIAGCRLALEYQPDCRQALSALEAILTRLARWAELTEVYRVLIGISTPEEAVQLEFRSAELWRDKLSNLEKADACLMAVLDREPDNLRAVQMLEEVRLEDAGKRRPDTRRFEDLLDIYDYHLSLEKTQAGQAALQLKRGQVFMEELSLPSEAFDAFEKALALDPVSRPAVHALSILHEDAGAFDEALSLLSREAELTGQTPEAAPILCRMGKIYLSDKQSPKEARSAWERALALDGECLEAIQALENLDAEEEDWDGYIRMVEKEAKAAKDADVRIRAHLKAARFYEESRNDDERAMAHYEAALAIDGTLEEAARPLSDLCVVAQKWARAEELLKVVISAAERRRGAGAAGDAADSEGEDNSSDLCRQFYRLGYVAEKLSRPDDALVAYQNAYELDSTYLPASEGYANSLVASGRFADAVAVYQAILIHHSEELTDLEIVDIYWQEGDLFHKLGQDERARKEFERALSHDAHHDPSLRSLAEISESEEKWAEAIGYIERLTALTDDAERFDLFVRAGTLAKDRLKDFRHAVSDLTQASALRPDSVPVLDMLLGLYAALSESAQAVEVLEKLIALTDAAKDPQRACRLLCALGEVCRDGLRDIPRAAKAFNDALDIDYRFLQAFGALEAMLGENRQWDMLEQNYQRMIQRIPRRPETLEARMAIFRALGAFYENVRRDLPATLQIYRMLAKSLPNDGDVLEKYARLAAVTSGAETEARDAWRQALPYASEPQKAVQAIARLSARIRDYDAAYVAAQVAQYVLGDVGADEREILTKLSPYAQRREQPRHPLTDALWARIYPPCLKGPMGQIFAFLQNQLGDFFAHRASAFGIDVKNHRVDLSGQEFALNTYRYIAQVCGMSDTALYSPYLVSLRDKMRRGEAALRQFNHPDKALLLEMVHVNPAALKAGGALFGETDHRRMAFQMVRELTFCRPEMVLARSLNAQRLEALFQAALYYTVPGYRPTADMKAIEAEGSILANLQSRPQFLAALSELCQQYVAVSSDDDLRGYIEATEFAANRAATLLSSDIRVAMEMLSGDQQARIPLRTRVRDLLLFTMSADFSALRASVGLSLQVTVPQKQGDGR